MHLTDRQQIAFRDDQLPAAEKTLAEQHLAGCPACREKLSQATELAAGLRAVLDGSAGDGKYLRTSQSAWRQFNNRLLTKEKTNMWQKLRNPENRPALAGGLVVALLLFSLAFAPVRAAANSFLGLFRVQQVAIVEVNPANLPEQLGSSILFQTMLTEDLQVDEIGEEELVSDAGSASQLAGIPVRLPSKLDAPKEIIVQSGAKMTFDIELRRVRSLLDEIGQEEIELPAELDGARVTVDIPRSVLARFGRCKLSEEALQEAGIDPDEADSLVRSQCTTLLQTRSPEITAPEGLDLVQIGQAFLQVMGMSPEEAAQFSQTVDWTTTLIVPIPENKMQHKDVTVDGVQGTYISRSLDEQNQQYMLIWVKDGIVHVLTGPGNAASALEIANSLK